ncbi:MAG: CDP-alcohol phosphatidyltransferase family protein, partial [Proteobacteria bacterium]|nr:CDP-alcohol phosphatidyltransferase family protein [Pseudomonadota bacterium]
MAVRPLVGTAVTPNHLTTLRLATGLAAAGALAVGTSPWQHVGAAIFVVSLVLDRADGELARLAGKTSP